MTILVTGANGQLGNEMRILAKGSQDKYIFTDVNQIEGVEISTYDYSGIYHYSNEGVCSWFDFTKMIAEYNGTTACNVQPCYSSDFPSPVKRPSYSVLDKSKIKSVFGVEVPYWTDSLKKCIANLK